MPRLLIYLLPLFLLTGTGVRTGDDDPQQLMRRATEQVVSRLDNAPALRRDRAALMQLIEAEVFPLVDFPRTARLTLGRDWQEASATQRDRFVAGMQQLLACTYSAAFASYTGQRIEYLPPRWSEDRQRVEVRVRILDQSGPPLPVSYRLQQTDGQWRIYDLVVEGVSLVATYRSSFREQIRRRGLDALIADLAARDRHCQNNH